MKPIETVILISVIAIQAGCGAASRPSESASQSPAATAPAPNASSAASDSTIAVAHRGSGSGEATGATVAAAAGTSQDAASAGGLKWKASKRWIPGPERPMRAATYRVPAAQGDAEDGECAVFFFGPGQGGGVEANMERWIGQFEQPDGRGSAERAVRRSELINGLSVAIVDLSGTYAGGGPMGSGGGKKAGYRLLGAIVMGPEAGVFFKLTGPAATVAAAQSEFQTLLKSLQK